MSTWYSKRWRWWFAALCSLLAALPVEASQAKKEAPPKGADAKPAFKPEELEQIVAPIALHPDSLISQILMASTYPLEVVEAARWVKANPKLKDKQLTAALEKQSWDPSIKSLVNFPQVLSMMDEKLDWTQKLGDAVLAKQADVLSAIQRLRAKAKESGNLKSSAEQKVTVEPGTQTIVIESASPEVIYVPTYNPTVVYGSWPYPAYPPYYYYPPGYVAGVSAFSFAAGVAVGAAWGYAWGGCNWHGGDIDVDVNRNVNFNQNIDRSNYQGNRTGNRSAGNQGVGASAGKGTWQHDSSHRKGVNYRDQATSQRYQGSTAATSRSREQFRGHAESGRQELGRDAGRTASQRQPAASSTASRQRSSGAFDGYSRSADVQRERSRAQTSRQSSPSPQVRSGGASRSAGGGRSTGGGRAGGGGRRR